MDSDEAAVIEDYESSLEDLTFNSKPLINVLTMLAEENSQHANVIVKLVERRISKVGQLQKLPALYLLDSIIKNVGGDYLNLIAQVIDTVFTTVFEKADEKTRRDLHKLRNTWPQYFAAKKLYDLDVKVKKLDPAWPISTIPPPSPTIHINPKFLKKVEESSPVIPAEVAIKQQDNVIQEHQSRLTQLQKLQEEQLALTEREIEEHKLKRELLLRKQIQERQVLLQQQQEQMLRLRLLADQKNITSDTDTDSSVPSPMEVSEVSSSKSSFPPPQEVVSTSVIKDVNNIQHSSAIRDPRLRKNGQQTANNKTRESERETKDPRISKLVDNTGERSPIHREIQQLRADTGRGSNNPIFESERLGIRPDGYSSTSFDERGFPSEHRRHENSSHSPVARNDGPGRREIQDQNRREDVGGNRQNRRKRDNRRRDRGRGSNRGVRGQVDETLLRDRSERAFNRKNRQDPLETMIHQREHPPDDRSRLLTEEPLSKKPKPLFEDHEIMAIRGHRAASPRKELQMSRDYRENSDQHVHGRALPPPHFGRHSPVPHPVDFSQETIRDIPVHEFDQHDNRWHGNLPPDHPEHRRFGSSFEIPQELTLGHKAEILSQAERRLSTGDISKEQHHDLMEKLEQFYELQRQQEQFDRMSVGRQHLGSERAHLEHRSDHYPDEPPYGRPQEPFRHDHGEQRMMGPRDHMAPGQPGIHEGPRPHMDVPRGQGPPMDHDGHFRPLDHPRPFPPVEHQGPPRPLDGQHPDFTLDRRGANQPMDIEIPRGPGRPPMRHPGPGDHSGQGGRHLMEHEQPGCFMPFEGSGRPLDHHGPGRSMDQPGPNQNMGRGMDHVREEHMRHDLPVEVQQREPVSHGWPMNHPGHWQGEPGRMSGPMQELGRSSPHMSGDEGPLRDLMKTTDRPDPSFRGEFRGPPMSQRDHRAMDTVPSSMGPIRPSQHGPHIEQNIGHPSFGPGRPMGTHKGASISMDRSREEPRMNIPMPQTPPRDSSSSDRGTPFTPNTMFQKKSVDDLFQRLVTAGIIKVMPEQVRESEVRSGTPPQAPPQRLPQSSPQPAPQLVPVEQIKPIAKIPQVKEKEEIPEIKLIPSELKKRHDPIVDQLCNGIQCSSCGLRFPGDVAAMYREHLDWHFRMNRREKDGRRIAHRQWYITLKDWLSYEEIGDPEERAHSSVFDVVKGAARSDSPDTTAVKENKSDSTPVLDGDGEAETTCDICCEKFEQFWEEDAEEWNYKNAVRVAGKTYHYLCYQDAKESHVEGEEEEEEEEMDTERPQADEKAALDDTKSSPSEKPPEESQGDSKGVKEEATIKVEVSSSKDDMDKVDEQKSIEECKEVKKETEVDSKASAQLVTNKDANGQSNDK